MKNLNLVYEKKVMKKERDNFEKLLSDAEAKTFEGDRIKSDLSDILDRPFENVEELKNSIRDLLSGNQILPDFFWRFLVLNVPIIHTCNEETKNIFHEWRIFA